MSSQKNIVMGYYLKVSKLFETLVYNYKICKTCNKEYTKQDDMFCNLHGDTLETKSESYKELVTLDSYHDEFESYCEVNNYNIAISNLCDLVASVYETNSHEFLISNVYNPEISLHIGDLEAECHYPSFLGKVAYEFFEPITNFLTLKGHKVELKLGILTYWN